MLIFNILNNYSHILSKTQLPAAKRFPLERKNGRNDGEDDEGEEETMMECVLCLLCVCWWRLPV